MAKFHGVVGYVETTETEPGVWKDVPAARAYFGDILEESRNWQTATKVNEDISISARISIVADPHLYTNLHNIRYVKCWGAAWKVTSVTQ